MPYRLRQYFTQLRSWFSNSHLEKFDPAIHFKWCRNLDWLVTVFISYIISAAGVVCHYQVGTLFLYEDAYKVQPEQIDARLCNTLIASYAILDIETFTIQAYSVEEEGIISDLTFLSKIVNIYFILKLYELFSIVFFMYYSEGKKVFNTFSPQSWWNDDIETSTH